MSAGLIFPHCSGSTASFSLPPSKSTLLVCSPHSAREGNAWAQTLYVSAPLYQCCGFLSMPRPQDRGFAFLPSLHFRHTRLPTLPGNHPKVFSVLTLLLLSTEAASCHLGLHLVAPLCFWSLRGGDRSIFSCNCSLVCSLNGL